MRFFFAGAISDGVIGSFALCAFSFVTVPCDVICSGNISCDYNYTRNVLGKHKWRAS